MKNIFKLTKKALVLPIVVSFYLLATTFSMVNAQNVEYLFASNSSDQPGLEIHKSIIEEMHATGSDLDNAIAFTLQEVLIPESTRYSDAVKNAIALDMRLSKQFFEEIIAVNSLIEVTKTLSTEHYQEIETIEFLVELAFTLYPDYAQDILDGVTLSGALSNEDVLILLLLAGADPISISESTAAGSPAHNSDSEEYNVVLGVTENMRIPGPVGELRVWIGSTSSQASFPTRLAQTVKSLFVSPEFIAARVEPFAPDFNIEPERTACIKLDSSGSEVRFTLTPIKTGTFYVAAQVELFTQADCSDSPFPKYSTDLEVLVSVGSEELAEERKNKFGAVFWEKLLDFWGALLALFFGLILFAIRGKLKKMFGFESN